MLHFVLWYSNGACYIWVQYLWERKWERRCYSFLEKGARRVSQKLEVTSQKAINKTIEVNVLQEPWKALAMCGKSRIQKFLRENLTYSDLLLLLRRWLIRVSKCTEKWCLGTGKCYLILMWNPGQTTIQENAILSGSPTCGTSFQFPVQTEINLASAKSKKELS